MSTNPYAPPKAQVKDVPGSAAAPALWNPNAAANWSLLFTPAFGAFLHMKNWQALGEPGKASAAKAWFIISLVLILGFIVVGIIQPDSKPLASLSQSLGFIVLLSWYFGSARAQAKYVKERFGTAYPHRGWLRPLLLALLALLGFFVVTFVIALVGAGISSKG